MGVGASSGRSWRLSWEGFGSYVGRCWLQDGGSLATLGDYWTSWRQVWRARAQDATHDPKKLILEGEGCAPRKKTRKISGTPPLKKLHKEGAGAPTSTWSSQLHLETRRTQAVDGAPYGPGHATCAERHVADILYS